MSAAPRVSFYVFLWMDQNTFSVAGELVALP